ncbi:MAG: phosphatidate cytidylyltransferase [Saprospiraceae bacterium]|nr:phosphatidate cytidylyltransferase [Saprospiraceae bacterium]MBK6565591.1 phosphatidate cytidylyltransferase [Saprospiraceae bacterium]MBK7523104.1 phosphatidate cytidylyltransferase [Saprospiraceae bacterium]MBK8081960.1 phosphatidate cytidylyltransferase [Saprospiraceae bacterium]MBK8370517.1 phosphatidate cytidylyltransferase [Saprospiraceae bacterium]
MDKKVLKTRVITGLIFGFFVIGSFLFGIVTTLFLLVTIGFGCTKEYLQITKKSNQIIIGIGSVLFLMVAAGFYFVKLDDTFIYRLLVCNAFLFLISLIHLWKPFINHNRYYSVICLFYTILPVSIAMRELNVHREYSMILLGVLFLIWASDSGAYFAGSWWGKHKLFERISPKKTWEGLIGGGILTLVVSVLTAYLFPEISMYKWMWISLVVWVMGTFGDLMESAIKRQYSIKDSGSILPGHGGFLDRFDSFIYVLPFVLLIIFYL